MELRVYVIDNHLPLAQATAAFLRQLSRVRVVGVSVLGGQTLRAVSASGAELVLLDLALPGHQGRGLLRALRQAAKPPAVVLLSMEDGTDYAALVQELGVLGHASKRELVHELPPLIALLQRQHRTPQDTHP